MNKNEIVGIFCLVGLVLAWIWQAEAVQSMQSGGNTKSYNKPFFISWFAHFPLVIFLPFAFCALNRNGSAKHVVTKVVGFRSMKQCYVVISLLAAMYFVPNVAWYIALPQKGITVGIATVVFNTAAVFVYIFSIMLRGEKHDWVKTAAVVLSFAGVAAISFFGSSDDSDDSSSSSGSSSGDGSSSDDDNSSIVNIWIVVIFFGAATYGLWEVLYKKYGVNERNTPISFGFFAVGVLGLVTLFIGLICIPILDVTGLEKFEMPPRENWSSLSITAAGGAIYNFCFFMALALLSSPLLVAMGVLITIPAAEIADFLMHGTVLGVMQIVGTILVGIGFVLIVYRDHKEEKECQEMKSIDTLDTALLLTGMERSDSESPRVSLISHNV